MNGQISFKTDYSLLNSLIKIDELINFLKENNFKSAGICDNTLSSSIEFYNKCLSNNIKPLIGLEIKYQDSLIYLYATNYSGYQNLLKINTDINNVTRDLLIKNSSHVIIVLPYESYNLKNDLNFYDYIYLAYKSKEEKISALLMSEKVIYFKSIKCFNERDLIYFKYLNILGGTNKINEDSNYLKLNEEDYLKIIEFTKLIDLKLPTNKRYIPKYKENIDSDKFLEKLAFAGLNKRLNNKVNDLYLNRLKYELEIIKKMNFVDYFLIVYDYTLYARKNNCLVGPGRGSAAGSLVCYSIGITDIDPVKYDLMFERFLNPFRVTMPDIDIDFESTKRDLIIDYVKKRYGKDFVAPGLTYNTLKTKLVLREITKILKINDELVNKFMKIIDGSLTLKENLKNEKVGKYLKIYPEISKTFEIALKLEGLKKNISTHAAGVVISSIKLDDVIPIIKKDDEIITGITMEYLENLGLLKMDFLSLKNLTIIANILNETDKNILKEINLNDENVLNVFKTAETNGIFQYETYAMKNLLLKLKPESFDDLIAAVALVRPGPASFTDEYILRKEKKKMVLYPDNSLQDILKSTYGIILYQEQIIAILEKMGGFSKAEADIIRRAISKKKETLILEYQDKFLKGALKKNYSKENASNVFKMIVKFSGYGFNKAHSTAYALIGYQMAYLKYYYPAYFTSELLKDNKDINTLNNYLLELKNKKIEVIKPDINLSEINYEIKNNSIILPLSIIKGISKNIAEEISFNKPYQDYFEFVMKNEKVLNENILETLIYAGALKSLGENENTLYKNMDSAITFASLKTQDENLKPILIKYPNYSEEFLRNKELELFGFYVGNHPASKYQDKKITKIKNIEDYLFKNIICIVIIDYIKTLKTKKGDDMAFITVSDETGTISCSLFKEKYFLLKDLNKGDLVLINGKASKSFDKIRIIINNITKEKSRK